MTVVPFDAHEDLLIGSMILNPQIIPEIAAELSPTEFADRDRGVAFATIVDAHAARQAILPELAKLIKSGETLLDIRWIQTVAGADVRDYGYHVQQIKEAAHRRALIRLADAVRDAIAAKDPPESIEATIRNHLDAIGQRHGVGGVDHSTIVDQLILQVAKNQTPKPLFTGLHQLDYDLGGLLPGELVVIGGRPGTGKTVLGMQIAKHNATKSKPVTVISMEMKNPELVNRLVCGVAKLDSRDVRMGTLPPEAKQRYIDAAQQIRNWPIKYWDQPAIEVNQLCNMARIDRRRHKSELLVVDYLGLLDPTHPRQSEYEKLTDASRKLKVLANELEIPVVVLAQLNRDGDGQRPRLANLRGSGAIEQDANIVLFTHSENQKDYVLIEKHRNGECGPVEVIFDRRTTSMHDPNTITVGGSPHYPTAEIQTNGSQWMP
jgi:replicative DNA helicase